MKRQNDIEHEVMKTLESLDEVEDIEVSPFFFTRVRAKIQEAEQRKVRSSRSLFVPAKLRLAGIIVLVAINLASFISLWQSSYTQTDDRQTYLSTFADEYGLTQDEGDLFEQ